MRTPDVERVMIVGSGGAGKTTLAVRVGAVLGLPVVHMDREYWRPGWVPTDDAAWNRRVTELAAAPRWVLDGNYGGSLRPRLDRAQLVVFLDLPRRLTIPAVLRRGVSGHGRSRPDMAPGCPERLSWPFLRWLWRYPHEARVRLLTAVDAAEAGERLVRLRSRQDVERWLAELGSEHPR